jgi:hypothetical protein
VRFPTACSFVGTLIVCQSAAAETIRFDRDVRPILSDKCFYCHGPDQENREADLRLDVEELARDTIGDADDSQLVARITSADPDEVMPPADSHKKLSATEIDLLTRWVADGGQWTEHWSFVPPAKPEVTDAGANPIDQVVRQRLDQERLQPTQQASREKLIRRVTYDLTGMPPTLAEIDAFLADESQEAFEKVVDRLLASNRYGQRMALMWLDAARYGDTSVYHADGPRDMWAWRDAIVDAYNDNMPFDQFSINQIAGDLRPDATDKQKLLAGFNRNNGTTDEGGAIAEEYRVEYAVDRVKTTSTVWLGLTMECAQCHDHKYDPISQEDYYKFYSFFNVSRDDGMQTRNGNAEPKVDVFDREKQKQIPGVEQQLTSVQQRQQTIESECEPELAKWIEQQSSAAGDQQVNTDGCIVQMLLSEGSGDNTTDTIANDRKAKIHGNAKWVKSRDDWGIQFDGGNYIDLGDVGNFERTDEFSYGGWFKPQKDTGGAMLARMDDGNGFRGYDLYVAGGKVAVHIIHKWEANAIKVTTKKSLEPDQWHHIFATYDGSSKAAGIKIYVDGKVWKWNVNEDDLTETIQTETSLLIGSRHPGSRLKGVVDEIQVYSRQLSDSEVKLLAESSSLQALLTIIPEERTVQQNDAIRRYYLTTQHIEYQKAEKQAAELNKKLSELRKPITSVMIMGDMEEPRDTFILNRGAYDSPTDRKVQSDTLSILPAMREGLPKNRLGMANWLFQDDHPLTARVAVNRYWQMFFGRGLVSTAEDFGAQGEFPSHAELLDWLAVDFRESGWDIKRFIKQLVMSETYRRSSRTSAEHFASDPQNRLYARGPRFRLQGEFIRDTALQLSGLLVDTYGGPGVKPYQPPGLWVEVGLSGKPEFKQDHGEKLYRRSLYTYWKRSAPPPSMQIFDAPTREKCTIKRARTNTPLQALVTLNDPQFVEASRHFAERMLSEGGMSYEDRIAHGFRLATARRPNEKERKVLGEILDAALEKYQRASAAAEKLLSVGESKRDTSLSRAQHAAWTIVASTILNLDETLTRE